VRAKVKVVPPVPDSPEAVFSVHEAVPLVPKPEESCCARLVARTEVPAQDEAKEWLTFERGLGLVRETEGGFHRVRTDPGNVDLARAFREGVFGVETLLSELEEPLTPDEAFERFEPHVPNWERHHTADWESVWRERVARLLDWTVLLGLAEREAGNGEENGRYARSRSG
jgi:hypothetical protein